MNDTGPFFIGWESKPAEPLSRFLGRMTLVGLVIGLGVGIGSAAWQAHIGEGTWDLNAREFTGVLIDSPTPMLVTADEKGALAPYYLVSEGKFGFPPSEARDLHLRPVRLRGTLIKDDHFAMLEVAGKVEVTGQVSRPPLGNWKVIGSAGFQGEIVDSKCYLGAMNPGVGKPHRACAIHCLRGGIPPLLITRDGEYILLVGPDGRSIHTQILDYVAEPVEVKGTLRDLGPIRVLSVDPSTIKRL